MLGCDTAVDFPVMYVRVATGRIMADGLWRRDPYDFRQVSDDAKETKRRISVLQLCYGCVPSFHMLQVSPISYFS